MATAKKRNSLRTHRKTFTLNEEENRALENHLKKYNVGNRSRFIRETLMLAILKRIEIDSPTLFDDLF
ncbi:MAG: hypothetical protein LBN23_03055 [Paludibacter sp.]|jgi:hypothetical protein|nr:hypothetical protein [Paludibacter sp.]